ncbi:MULTISPECIES: hypothetical protein [unclassified Stenotrophomonas]|uniref:hypothetical protein n=1 Tax=unclassified Stenotrophomonas TaxID=196198 RepID=UPI000D17016D|nr:MULTISPECIES: hypothetical protein [unclassified Stenotrophomonas]PTA72087.1 hypothetical protein C9412_10190 [Stenotrophomonas sp. Nf1]PTA81529.1 hypothetical protein C9416_07740 [Stenotrophomonas sp. Nf4]
MSLERCFAGVCFTPLDAGAPKIFGFSEFLAGLALMILAWTIADVRYRFRIRTAPIPLQGLTFGVVVMVGVFTLLTDLWRAEEWLVPQGNLLSPGSWQALLASLFLLTFLTWTWFAFIKPPTYGKRNAKRFAHTLYRFVLKGSPTDLAVVADELARSARALVHYATNRERFERFRGGENHDEQRPEPSKVEAYANDILLLIADKRLCRAIVSSSPATALAVFQEIGKTGKYGVQIGTFARNIVDEALANKESFLYHEAEGYESGLIGYVKPLSQAMFANYEMVEEVQTMLAPDILRKSEWDSGYWEAYCRVVLMTFHDYVERGFWNHSSVLYRAKGYIENAASDLYKLDGIPGTWDSDSVRRLRVVVKFIGDAVKVLDRKGVPEYIRLRIKEEYGHPGESFYDHIASMIFEVVLDASAVTSPQWECWTIQHNSVWGELLRSHRLDNSAGKVIKFKLRRLLYDEVADMRRFPNFKGARILAFCLNVMGLRLSQGNHDRDSRALHKAILAWTKRNYAWLHEYNPRIAEHCLVDGLTFEVDNLRIVKTYPAEGLRREPAYVYFDVDAAQPGDGPNAE